MTHGWMTGPIKFLSSAPVRLLIWTLVGKEWSKGISTSIHCVSYLTFSKLLKKIWSKKFLKQIVRFNISVKLKPLFSHSAVWVLCADSVHVFFLHTNASEYNKNKPVSFCSWYWHWVGNLQSISQRLATKCWLRRTFWRSSLWYS